MPPPPDHATRKTANQQVYVVIVWLVVAGLGVVVIYLYLRYGQAHHDHLGASVQPEVGKSPLTVPLLPIVAPKPNTAKVHSLDAVKVLRKRTPLPPRPHFPPHKPRDGDQIRGMSPGFREGLAMTVPTPRRRLPTPGSGFIGTSKLERALHNLRRDVQPFNLDLVLPFRLWFEEEAAQPDIQDGVAARLQPDVQDGAAGGQVVEEPLGGRQLHLIPVAEGEGQEEEKKPRRKRKVPTEEEQRMASLRRSGLRSSKKGRRGEGGEED